MTAPTVNAYYNPPGNEIVFPAGIMQSPAFYGPSAPLYLAYGAFGAVSGHELSHAFDSTGRHYDENGNYTDWWDPKTVKAFEERAQCFVDQYSKFPVQGPGDKVLHVNGRLTLGENIADAGGLTASFHAWKKHDEAKSDAHLPGLTAFSKEQLFFISYGNWWCSKTTKEAAEKAIYSDPHAPKSARIIVSVVLFVCKLNCTDPDYRKLWRILASSKMHLIARTRSQSASSGNEQHIAFGSFFRGFGVFILFIFLSLSFNPVCVRSSRPHTFSFRCSKL